MKLILILLAYLTGVVIAVQSWVNAGLGVAMQHPLEAAVISFGSACAILTVALGASRGARRALLRVMQEIRAGKLHAACLGAGLGGGLFVASQTLAVPSIGVAVFTVVAVGGQLLTSLAGDRLGMGPAGPRAVNGVRVVAAVLATIAVALSMSDRMDLRGAWLPLAILSFSAGSAIALQMPMNARVAVAGRSTLVSAWFNVAVATAGLVIALVVFSLTSSTPLTVAAQPWYLFLGGPISVVNVLLVTFVVSRTGILLFSICQVTGLVTGALVVDLVAPLADRPITFLTVAGAGLLFCAAAVVIADPRS